MKNTFKDTDKVTLNFTHITTGEDGQITADRNPLTGDWLRKEKVGDRETYYYSDKTTLKSLIRTIMEKNKVMGLKAELKIEPVKKT